MSLLGTLNIGKTALIAHQAAIQVASNNIANAGNAYYTRQKATLSPAGDTPNATGLLIGNGVNLTGVERQIDDALEERLRGSISDSESASVQQDWLGRVQSVFNALGDNDLSSQLTTFFNGWSTLANNPQDKGQRQVVIQTGDALASTFQDLHSQLDSLRQNVDSTLSSLAQDANTTLGQVAQLNGQIISAEATSGGTANALRDQRDAALQHLAQLMNIQTRETDNGAVNVTSGSLSLVLGTTNRGLDIKQEMDNGQLVTKLVVKADGSTLQPTSGQIGALITSRADITNASSQLDSLAGSLVFELNKLHSSGQGLDGFSQVTAPNAVQDSGAALNSDAAGLDFKPATGSFYVQVRQKDGGSVLSAGMAHIDLDGLNGDDTTLTSLASQLSDIPGVSASVVNGKLKIQAVNSDTEITFSNDSSGTLAALGINSFFTGSDASDIAVSQALKDQPRLLAAAANGSATDNQTATAIASLQTQPLAALGNGSLSDSYDAIINGIAVAANSAGNNATAAGAVRDTLQNQHEALSGVSMDEETINLMQEQRAFQGAARVISTIDDLMKTLLAIT